MKKLILSSILCTAIGAILPTYAKTSTSDSLGCLQQIDKRVMRSAYGEYNALLLESCYLQDEDMATISAFLAKRPDIKDLDLDDNNAITSAGLAVLFAKKPALLNFSINHVHLGLEGASEIAKVTSLKSLNTDYGDIDAQGAAVLASLPHLDDIHLDHSNIEDAGAIALSKNPSIQFVSVTDNNIGSKGATALAQLPKLSILDISNNYIGDDGAIALVRPYTIYFLVLNGNHITDKGASAYASNSDVGFLLLQHNDITDQGAIALANNTNMQAMGGVDVSYNRIGTAGITALENSDSITWVWTAGNISETTMTKQPSSAKLAKLITPSNKAFIRSFCSHKSATVCKQLKEKNLI